MGLFGRWREERELGREFERWQAELRAEIDREGFDDQREYLYRAVSTGGAYAVSELLRNRESPFRRPAGEPAPEVVDDLLARGRWAVLMDSSLVEEAADTPTIERAYDDLEIPWDQGERLREIWRAAAAREGDHRMALARWLVEPLAPDSGADPTAAADYIGQGALLAWRLLEEGHATVLDDPRTSGPEIDGR